jgi:hypothetical protein
MSESMKVQPHHLERGAYLYVRQSSMRQVIENVESTKRQVVGYFEKSSGKTISIL